MNVELLEATDDPDRVICTAARNDYMGEFVGDKSFEEIMEPVDGETFEEKQRTLISHLFNHGHFGCAEHPSATFAVEGISRSCMAQLTRHRHVSFDVQSMRYVKFEDLDPGEAVVEIPELDDTGTPGRNGSFAEKYAERSDTSIIEGRRRAFTEALHEAFESYQKLLDLGVAPENARMVLPIGTKVNLVMSLNARMLMHVADMRAAADAQWEIRDLTNQVLELAEEWAPITFQTYKSELQGRKNRLAP